jgi:predicted RNase H-like HicB family nuclease
MEISCTAVYEKVPEGYVAYARELTGANTQVLTLEEAREKLKDAIRERLLARREIHGNP